MPNASILYLIPSTIQDDALGTLPPSLLGAVRECQVFFTENERTSRRFLKRIWKEMVIDHYEWYPIGKKDSGSEEIFKKKIREGRTMGLLSEAGCPGIADPGQALVALAHRENIPVRPLVGPSSIVLALMASGMNGQQFRFAGYLPIEHDMRSRRIRELEKDSEKSACTQIFIETPYRNDALMETLLKSCRHQTLLCVASDLTGPQEFISTRTIGDWKKKVPVLNKKPAIFLLYA